mmetsp:Transcript_3081/g.6971  ORF Transcript_3081/g.6971 Transcript_3081/m.6971 type:complete len:285 (+) Transcript_3081:1059-1913(+)
MGWEGAVVQQGDSLLSRLAEVQPAHIDGVGLLCANQTVQPLRHRHTTQLDGRRTAIQCRHTGQPDLHTLLERPACCPPLLIFLSHDLHSHFQALACLNGGAGRGEGHLQAGCLEVVAREAECAADAASVVQEHLLGRVAADEYLAEVEASGVGDDSAWRPGAEGHVHPPKLGDDHKHVVNVLLAQPVTFSSFRIFPPCLSLRATRPSRSVSQGPGEQVLHFDLQWQPGRHSVGRLDMRREAEDGGLGREEPHADSFAGEVADDEGLDVSRVALHVQELQLRRLQ